MNNTVQLDEVGEELLHRRQSNSTSVDRLSFLEPVVDALGQREEKRREATVPSRQCFALDSEYLLGIASNHTAERRSEANDSHRLLRFDGMFEERHQGQKDCIPAQASVGIPYLHQ